MNDRPWMTALEMQFGAMKIVSVANAQSGQAVDLGHWSGGDNFYSRDREYLRAAETYSWSAETATAVVLASKSIPNEARITLPLVPSGTSFGWWWFDAPILTIPVPTTDGNKRFVRIHALLFGLEKGDTVYFRSFSTLPDDLRPGSGRIGSWISWSVGLDETLADLAIRGEHQVTERQRDIVIKSVAAMTRFFIAGSAWLQQRVAIISSGHVERHRRKQLAREHNAPLPPSDVKVIQLRRTEAQPHPTADGENVEWSCRWIVNGHWRNQPYKDERKLIYIMPYVKGPDDMPLKVPTHTVYQVSR